ncbi:keratinocyte differentiation-associated protein [Diceros bicornis minor]|uniref:Keratinocyte differentiation-associated protein n=1 Tax=Ceratotherium simum simum TaxID=73337 RepID=A0ABM0I409_CERSS|nr:PREDICTED: keratinocyte differentiation-associated protein [Ceratotherium simum simum]XP_058386921.1 keratinocyte differentiation-associated protein [Diceros bicornis minor]
MKIPALPAVALLSLLAFHSAQGASLGSSEEETTIGNYAAGPEAFNTQFLNIDKLRAAFKPEEFLNWHALVESIKRKLPFLNWDAFPKLRGLRNAAPDAQ